MEVLDKKFAKYDVCIILMVHHKRIKKINSIINRDGSVRKIEPTIY